jgi:hypothetical protein
MLRFAFAIVFALHAWSSELLAGEGDWCAPDGEMLICDTNHHLMRETPHYKTLGEMPLPLGPPMPLGEPSYMISGRPKLQDSDPELTATKGDVDALNKRLDQLENLIRCESWNIRQDTSDGCTGR